MKNEIYTKHLCLVPLEEEALSKLAQAQSNRYEKERLELSLRACREHPEQAGWYTVWQILQKQSQKEVGWIQFCGTPQNGRVEVNCALIPTKENEKMADEAMKRIAKWAFANQKDLYYVSTWLADDNSLAAQVLENAGFTESFASDGMVHYEKERPRVHMLALCMCFFTVLSFIPGFLFDNYPLWVTIGIAAGILPGTLLENLMQRISKKRSQIPDKACPEK